MQRSAGVFGKERMSLPIDFHRKLTDAKSVYTFRDFILLPALSDVEPSKVDLSTRFSANLRLALPFASSPMDTVTEADMAIALARQGGIGIIHRNLSVEEQVQVATKVKRAESFIIRDVFTTSPSHAVSDAVEVMSKHRISGLPVVSEGRLVGIVTRRDVNFADSGAKIAEVMTTNVVTAGGDVTIEDAKKIMHKHRMEKLPVVGRSRELLGLITIKDIYSREQFSDASRDDQGRLVVGAALNPSDLDRAKALDRYVDVIVCDVSHFHNTSTINAAKRLAKEVSADLVIGNLGTKEAIDDCLAVVERIDGVRAGVGSGSICVTSEVTKAGAPTLFAVAQVAVALQDHKADIPIVADGGIRSPGDASLALAAGASSVMMGNVFAGCTESPGELIKIGGKYYKPYRGMGSPSARARRYAMDRYDQPSKGIAEGVEGVVPYRGDVETVVQEFTSGIKAAFGYAGAKTISDLWSKASFGAVTAVGIEELKPHDIILPGEGKV